MVASRKTVQHAIEALLIRFEVEGIDRDKLGIFLATLCDIPGNSSWYWTTRELMREFNYRIKREIDQQKAGEK